ncbi:chemotaxis protein CheB [Rhodopila sp.]|uniref:chemotaxis protein CheB n=1 Tax=Rhodopila sp. TaxID=2480087 RepID=UPI003D12A245
MRDIIVIGGSTGAIEVLAEICANFPANLAAAVFVVVHVGSSGNDLLAGIVDRRGPLRAIMAVDEAPIERGTITVAPADHHLLVMTDQIRLGRGPRENMTRPAIDPLFRSAAISHGPQVIGVLLSGMLNDGSAGLAAIKRCGGVAVVQNPSDARADEMPLSALRACDVDYRARTVEFGGLLTRLAREPAGAAVPIPPDIALEVAIALGTALDTPAIRKIADPVALTCPACGGVLSELQSKPPLRFRCQTGHGFTAEILDQQQSGPTEQAIMVALRIVQERATLTERMAQEARAGGRNHSASMLEQRLEELRKHAEQLRQVAINARY